MKFDENMARRAFRAALILARVITCIPFDTSDQDVADLYIPQQKD